MVHSEAAIRSGERGGGDSVRRCGERAVRGEPSRSSLSAESRFMELVESDEDATRADEGLGILSRGVAKNLGGHLCRGGWVGLAPQAKKIFSDPQAKKIVRRGPDAMMFGAGSGRHPMDAVAFPTTRDLQPLSFVRTASV